MAELRAVADALERRPLAEAGVALALLEPFLAELRRWVERAGLVR